jgi:excisionase family DNA binding protein
MNLNIELLTLAEAAHALRLGESTLRGWRLRGRYPDLFVRVGGRVLVRRCDLEALIEQGKNHLTGTAQRNGVQSNDSRARRPRSPEEGASK